jgi:hypothetical protein
MACLPVTLKTARTNIFRRKIKRVKMFQTKIVTTTMKKMMMMTSEPIVILTGLMPGKGRRVPSAASPPSLSFITRMLWRRKSSSGITRNHTLTIPSRLSWRLGQRLKALSKIQTMTRSQPSQGMGKTCLRRQRRARTARMTWLEMRIRALKCLRMNNRLRGTILPSWVVRRNQFSSKYRSSHPLSNTESF